MIVVIDKKKWFRNQLVALSKNVCESVIGDDTIDNINGVLEKYSPGVIVFGPSTPVDSVIDITSSIAIKHPEVSVVMITKTLDANMLRDAMRAGVNDVIEKDAPDEQVISSISRAFDTSKKLKESLDLKGESPDEQPAQKVGRVITSFSTKGGVGKSVVSTNLAVALAKLDNKKVVILDLDLQFGDVGIMLQVAPEHTLYDVTQAMDRLDQDMLQGFLATHTSGLKALLAPVRPHEVDAITASQVKEIINLLKNFFDYVVIDTPPAFNDIVLTAFDESDLIYLIATMDMPSVKNIKLAIQILRQLGYPTDAIRFILNRADSKVCLEIDEVEKTLDIKAEVKIPSDRIIPKSVNKGVPVVIEQPRSQAAKCFFALADKINKMDVKVKPLQSKGSISHNVRKLTRRLS